MKQYKIKHKKEERLAKRSSSFTVSAEVSSDSITQFIRNWKYIFLWYFYFSSNQIQSTDTDEKSVVRCRNTIVTYTSRHLKIVFFNFPLYYSLRCQEIREITRTTSMVGTRTQLESHPRLMPSRVQGPPPKITQEIIWTKTTETPIRTYSEIIIQ